MEAIAVSSAEPRDDHYRALECGNILLFPRTPFDVPEPDRAVLRQTAQTAGAHHKNIAYRPAQDRVTGFDKNAPGDPGQLRAALRAYSAQALVFLRALLPRYMQDCRVDFASFRPQEEAARDLPLNKRNDLLHVDAFPTRPTRGDMILRLFTNINTAQPRVWVASDPFEPLAVRYAVDAGLNTVAHRAASPSGKLQRTLNAVLRRAGVPLKNRSAYDRFMLDFHDYLKQNGEYQSRCAKYRFEFPPDSTWIVFTDVVPHAVLSGRYALEQTVIVNRDRLLSRERAPIAILERICGQALAAV